LALANKYKKYGVLNTVITIPVGTSLPKLIERVIVSDNKIIIAPIIPETGKKNL
jgi:hypothetical protein